ncbi:MAG: glycerate kinase [Candidatus Bathyarchaeota archaeon]|nr:MAG: glycerate kinase [Candidatus Bathyarchaeota archaeon]
MANIRNRKVLVNNGRSTLDRKARKLALDSLEAALEAANPQNFINSRVRLKGEQLTIDGRIFDLDKFNRIFVVGGGKASGGMAEALEAILEDRITNGIVSTPYGSEHYRLKHVTLHLASHPLPDKAGVKGVRLMIDLVTQANKDDLVICLISGGGSSLMPLPRHPISLEDKKTVTKALLESGAGITEINTVRKHISDFKGGWLAKQAHPATVVNLLISDVVGDRIDSIASGPTVPDSSTFQDAIEVLNRYGLWKKTPQSVKHVLLGGKAGKLPETLKPDDEAFTHVHTFIVGNNSAVTLAAYRNLQKAGLNTLLLPSSLEGEAKHVGRKFASFMQETTISEQAMPKPAGLVVGGETTVTVVGEGRGGRNQETALSAALPINGIKGAAIASISTDGLDGPTDAAGALADGSTILHSQELQLDAEELLAQNDSYTVFEKLGDLIFTGPTSTNVNDILVIVMM